MEAAEDLLFVLPWGRHTGPRGVLLAPSMTWRVPGLGRANMGVGTVGFSLSCACLC